MHALSGTGLAALSAFMLFIKAAIIFGLLPRNGYRVMWVRGHFVSMAALIVGQWLSMNSAAYRAFLTAYLPLWVMQHLHFYQAMAIMCNAAFLMYMTATTKATYSKKSR